MTNKEIDKLLFMLDKKSLEDVKKYLNREKEINISKIRQKTFENYLTTNKFFINTSTMPKLYVSDSKQIFTNGISIYIINSNFFKTNTKKLQIEKNYKRTTAHRFEIREKTDFDKYLNYAVSKYGNIESECIDLWDIANTKFTSVEYFNNINNSLHEEKFNTEEINTANILLDNPKYSISHSFPILKAEGKIGKCYILGYKNK